MNIVFLVDETYIKMTFLIRWATLCPPKSITTAHIYGKLILTDAIVATALQHLILGLTEVLIIKI